MNKRIKLSHIAVAAPKIQSVLEILKKIGLESSHEKRVESEKVQTAFVPMETSNLNLEVLEPLSFDSPISKFLDSRGPGLHHLSFEVENVEALKEQLENSGFRILPPGIRKTAHGRGFFVHPKSFAGVLVEFEQT